MKGGPVGFVLGWINERTARILEETIHVGTEERLTRGVALATLERSRSELNGRVPKLLALSVGVVYGFIALQVGQMLTFGPTGQSATTYMVLWNNGSTAWWNYPALLVIFPGGVLALPFFATVVMVLVSIGVGIGMSVGILLTARLLVRRRRELSGPASAGALAGLTPAMIGLVTLGACCSTTAAATAGIGALAQASGSSLNAVLLNGWYIGVFQLAVLWVALVAQEQLLSIYGVLLGPSASPEGAHPRPSGGRRTAAGFALRLGLVAAGITWALAGLAQWGFGGAIGAAWSNDVGWILSHALLAGLAVGCGLFPDVLRGWARLRNRAARWFVAGVASIGSVTLLAWLPGGVASSGWHGLVNEILAATSAPSAWAPISAGDLGPTALALRWAFQFLLLGAFGLAFAWAPGPLRAALTGSVTSDTLGPRSSTGMASAPPVGPTSEPVSSAASVR